MDLDISKDKQFEMGSTQNVGQWLSKEIRHRLKTRNLAHVWDDPHHESVPRSKIVNSKDMQPIRRASCETGGSVISPISKVGKGWMHFEIGDSMSATMSNFSRANNLTGTKPQKSVRYLSSRKVPPE